MDPDDTSSTTSGGAWAATSAATRTEAPRARSSRKAVRPRFHCLSWMRSQTSSDPLVECRRRSSGGRGEAEIPSASRVRYLRKLPDDHVRRGTGHALPSRDLAHSILHLVEGFLGDAQAGRLLPSTYPKGSSPGSSGPKRGRHRALGLVDSQVESCHTACAADPGPALQHVASERTLVRRPHSARKHDRALLQFLVHFVQEHVRQERRERTALRRTLPSARSCTPSAITPDRR